MRTFRVDLRGIGGAEEVMGKEVMNKQGPIELPW